jgi:hypothetical protein
MRTVARIVAVAVIGLSGTLGLAPAAASAACPNEAFRKDRSARLPDCRAYELVTPKELGRTGVMTFQGHRDSALPSTDGEHLALQTFAVFFEPGVSIRGTESVFSRTSSGWVMRPVSTPALADTVINLQSFSPDLSQVGFASADPLAAGAMRLQFGPVGGPYSTAVGIAAATSPQGERASLSTGLVGANGGTPTVSAFSDVLLGSRDSSLLSAGPEREAAEQTQPETPLLYEFAEGRLRLVNVDREGRLVNPCGAVLGNGPNGGNALNAVSDDGSRVFFKSPEAPMPGCPVPALYMRVDGRETVEVSAPEGLSVPPASRQTAQYDGASRDGSKVFFSTGTALTPAAVSLSGTKLYEYDTEAPIGRRLTLIAHDVASAEENFINPSVVVADDGSTVYYSGLGTVEVAGQPVSVAGIWRYDTVTRRPPRFVAVPRSAQFSDEPDYSTPAGDFLVFASGSRGSPGPEVLGPQGLEEERRGAGNEQLYRYDAADGSVMCVSCGEGAAPAKGGVLVPAEDFGTFNINDRAPTVVSISDDGRRVFFQTSANLVPQDANETTASEERDNEKDGLGGATDVYEWEQAGTEEAPGVFCQAAVGCTHLISAGEAVGPERFLGASEEGRDVFFTSAAQLVAGATPEFTNIYDARVDGGFPPPPTTAECTSCQGVGSPAPQFGAGGSLTFTGPGNAAVAPGNSATPPSKPKPAHRCKRGFKRGRHGRCVRSVSRKRGR